MQVVPYLAQKMPVATIAALFKVDETTIKRWAAHPDVRKALGEVSEAVVDATKVAAVELVDLAWATLRDVMRSGEDERTRVTAAQVVLDRTGHGPTSKQELSGPQGAPLTVTFERAEDIVRAEQLLREVKR
jgi:hypothetical protein